MGNRAISGNARGSGMATAARLVGLTLAYNVIEAAVALLTGARADSIALFGFGLDSVIECAASAALLWRIAVEAGRALPEEVERSEARVHRFIGWTFFALSAYIITQAARTLFMREAPSASPIGIALAAASLVVMPVLAWAKIRVARQVGSRALESEAKETLACAVLSLTLLAGLVANAAAGWWWADPAAALLMVPWLLREGVEGVRGGEGGEDEDADGGWR